ncbi:unnamed protein product [Allacma fusca]|uniref:ascorbate ferrireductase (transmembrane) n=1 Tax=Allacma fusca TaxID=39272 RepID=A0A8J2P714_9HEXA|nr:unnamed protein product [Allacma fusca]
MSTFNILAHASTLIFGVAIIWLAQPGSSLFSYHPALMTLGLMVLVPEGILLMTDKRVPLKYKITIHWICSAVGVTLGFLGFLAIYINKENKGAGHFLTWHGTFGLITLVTLTMVPMGGIGAKYSVAISKIVPIKPKFIKQVHRTGGLVASIGIFATVILSLYSSWFQSVIQESITTSWLMIALAVLPRLYLVSVPADKTMNKS